MPEWFISMSHVPSFNLLVRCVCYFMLYASCSLLARQKCSVFRVTFSVLPFISTYNSICVLIHIKSVLQCIFHFGGSRECASWKPSANVAQWQGNFCHHINMHSLELKWTVIESSTEWSEQLCWHVFHSFDGGVRQRPQYNLTNLLMIHTH